MSLWYMRDNHTFRRLTPDVNTALAELEDELEQGNTYGMLTGGDRSRFPYLHARGRAEKATFLAEAKVWLTKAVIEEQGKIMEENVSRALS